MIIIEREKSEERDYDPLKMVSDIYELQKRIWLFCLLNNIVFILNEFKFNPLNYIL